MTPAGGVSKFILLVFEDFGNWGNEADNFLDERSKNPLILKEDPINISSGTDGENIFDVITSGHFKEGDNSIMCEGSRLF